MDDRDRRAPEPLPGQQPVAQPVVHRRRAQALLRQDLDDPGDRLGLGQPVQRAGVDQHAVARRRDPGGGRVGAVGGDHHPHRQPEPPGEVQVALVVRGHRHDRAGAVVGQHVVGRPDRDALAVHRVDRVHAQEDAGLLPVGLLPLDVGQLPHLRHVGVELGPLGVRAQVRRQRRVRGDDEERRPVERVRPGGVDGDGLAAPLDLELDVGPGRAADPVPLHGQHPVGPVAHQRGRVGQQPVGVLGDLEVPLGQHPADDLGAAPLAPAVHDLLVGQHGLVLGAPVDVAALAVGQPALEEPQEQPLVPPVVLRVAGLQPARPVERRRVPAERRRLRLDVLVGPVDGVRVVPDRRVLGGQPERVPADRVQHVLAAQEVVPGHRVADGVRLGVPHVQVARRVREHVGQVEPLARVRRVVAGAERLDRIPVRLPFVLNVARIVALRLVGVFDRSHRVLIVDRSGLGVPASRAPCVAGALPAPNAVFAKTKMPPAHEERPRRRQIVRSARLAKEQPDRTHPLRIPHPPRSRPAARQHALYTNP